MSLQNVRSQNMNLVLSTDAKPRLKWTPELHQRFVEAVNQLGGADKATPKSLMRVMGIGGLTLYHLKSHLQKFRLGKSQQTETYMKTKDDDCRDQESSDGEFSQEINDGTQNNMNESLQIAHALRMQMEVQRKLHEQIEVQRHLQLRIEAQGKYLQTVLKKAQDTLSGYSSSSNGIENAKAELLQLISMVNTSCTSSSFSELTDAGGSISVSKEMDRNERRGTLCSTESSLTSSESSGRDEEKHVPYENPDHQMLSSCIELLLMEGRPEEKPKKSGKNRMQSMINDGTCIEQPLAKRTRIPQGKSDEQSKRCALFDLNRQCQSEIDTSSKGIDLNSKGTDQL